jgi:V-type H+-transporting ATPase subunit C
MEAQLWAIAVKNGSVKKEIEAKAGALCTLTEFKVPKHQLRVGTLDTLMALSDDLAKMDTMAEGAMFRIYRQLFDLKEEAPTVIGVDISTYTAKQWEWDSAKFQLKTPLRELCESISGRIAGLDDELKAKVSEFNNLKGVLQQYDRKTQGNLMVRSLTEIVTADDVVEDSEYLLTLMVVVPKHGYKEFYSSYESMGKYVVPRSASLLKEDAEYGLFAVTVFKKFVEEFKQSARDKRYTVRDFTFEATKLDEEANKKDKDQVEFDRLKGLLMNWCQINFAEAYIMMMHLKAVRVFVEAVLRYGFTSDGIGMRPNFEAYIVQVKKGKLDTLRKMLAVITGGAGAAVEEDEGTIVPGATGEFYPYVYVGVETEPQAA